MMSDVDKMVDRFAEVAQGYNESKSDEMEGRLKEAMCFIEAMGHTPSYMIKDEKFILVKVDDEARAVKGSFD